MTQTTTPDPTAARLHHRTCRADRHADLDPLERRARKLAGAKLGLYIHAAVFVAVNLLLLAIALLTSPAGHGLRWSMFPLFGWGLGLMFHALAVLSKTRSDNLFQRMVDKERQKLMREQPTSSTQA